MLDTMRHRAYLYPSIAHPKPHGSAVVATYSFADQRYTVGIQHLPCGHKVALTHLDRSRWRQCCEHACPADQARSDPLRLCSRCSHQLDETGNRSLGELGRVAVQAAQRRSGQENVRQATYPCLGVVENHGDATAEPDRDEGIVCEATAKFGDLHHQFASGQPVRR